MDFRIADTFTDSLARLTGDEQKAGKTTAFDLQIDPANPGMQFHKLDKANDRNFWSVRVSGDLRLIVHRSTTSLLLCYVDHHDSAYRWAERRKLETHPKTGAAQLVELRETVRKIAVEKYVEAEGPAVPKRALFVNASDDELLGFGVPAEWLGLEFKAVAIMACDDEVIPLQARIDAVGDEADLEDVFNTERHLLYVGCTRARDHLLITSVDPSSEFLDDF